MGHALQGVIWGIHVPGAIWGIHVPGAIWGYNFLVNTWGDALNGEHIFSMD